MTQDIAPPRVIGLPGAVLINLNAVIVALLALSGTFATLATYMVALERLIMLVMACALPMLWWRGEVVFSRGATTAWAGIVVVALAFNCWLLMQVPASSAVPTLGVLVIGTLAYFLAKRAPAGS